MARRLVLVSVAVVAATGLALFVHSRYPGDLGVGCAAEAGPTALVAFDASTGERRWTAEVGFHRAVTLADGVVEVDAVRRRTRLDAAGGAQLSCVDLPEEEGILDVAAATARPELRLRGESDAWRVETAAHDGGSQLQRVIATSLPDGEVTWDAVVPALSVQLLDDHVLTIDQTGGTGVFSGTRGDHCDTRVTLYDPSTGDLRWRTAMPCTSHLGASTGVGYAVSHGTTVMLLDGRTGEVVWEADHGNPAKGGQYSENGQVQDLLFDAESDLLIAAVRAERPYRD